MKLTGARGIRCESRVRFFALCAQIIRHILVDHARHRGYAKRGGDLVRVPLDEALVGMRARGVEVLALDEPWSHYPRSIPGKDAWWSCDTSAA